MRKYVVRAVVVIVIIAVMLPLHFYTRVPVVGWGMSSEDMHYWNHFLEIGSASKPVWTIHTFTGEGCATCPDWVNSGVQSLIHRSGSTFKVEQYLYHVISTTSPEDAKFGMEKWKKLRPLVIEGAVSARSAISYGADLFWPEIKGNDPNDILNLIPFVVVVRTVGRNSTVYAAMQVAGYTEFCEDNRDGIAGALAEASELNVPQSQNEISARALQRFFDDVVSQESGDIGGAGYLAMKGMVGKPYTALLSPAIPNGHYYKIPFAHRSWVGGRHSGESTVPAFDVDVVDLCVGDFVNPADVETIEGSGAGNMRAQKICANPPITKDSQSETGEGWYYLWVGRADNPTQVRTCDPRDYGCLVGRWVCFDGAESCRWMDLQRVLVFLTSASGANAANGGMLEVYVPAEDLSMLRRDGDSVPNGQNGSSDIAAVPASGSESIPIPTPTFMPRQPAEVPADAPPITASVPTVENVPATVPELPEATATLAPTIAPTATPMATRTPVPTPTPVPTTAKTVLGMLSKPSAVFTRDKFPFLFDGEKQVLAMLFKDTNLGAWTDTSVPFGILWVEVTGPIEANGAEWGRVVRIGFASSAHTVPPEGDLESKVRDLKEAYPGVDAVKYVLWDQIEVKK